MGDLLNAGIPLSWIGGIAVAVLIVGLLLILSGRSMRRSRGFAPGQTLDLDGRTLFSARLGLTGRPDRIVEEAGMPIPEEWKPTATRVHPSHEVQLGTYLILIEEETGIRPPQWGIIGGELLVSGEKLVSVHFLLRKIELTPFTSADTIYFWKIELTPFTSSGK